MIFGLHNKIIIRHTQTQTPPFSSQNGSVKNGGVGSKRATIIATTTVRNGSKNKEDDEMESIKKGKEWIVKLCKDTILLDEEENSDVNWVIRSPVMLFC